jgi:hypothetical protein
MTPAEAGDGVHPAPPRGFDPLTSTPSELSKYGFAPEPRPGPARSEWVAAMSKIRTSRFISPIISVECNASSSIGTGYRQVSTTYAGNGDLNEGCACYTEVVGEWVVPTIGDTTYTPSYSSIWPGISCCTSFDGPHTLVQAGTEQDWYVQGILMYADYYAWYQACCKKDPTQHVIDNLSVQPGDQMYVDVYAPTPYSVDYTIADFTQKEYTTPSEAFTNSTGYDAEFILERTCETAPNCDASNLPFLANFGKMKFTGAYVVQDGATTSCVAQVPHNYFTMYNDQNVHIAVPDYPTDPNGCDFEIDRLNPGR